MSYVGDYAPASTVDLKFTTTDSTGLPTTLSGTPAVSVYQTNSTTESTTGVTLTVDFDGRTGLNHVRIDTSADGTFYADGRDFQMVITTGTVSGVSVVGVTVGSFSLNNRAALRPTTAGRTLNADASGRVDIGSWLGSAPNALQSGRVDSYLGAVAAGVIAAASFAANALDAVWSTTTRTLSAFAFSVTVGTNNDKTGYALTSAYDPAKTASQAGDAMALTSGERTTLAGVIWATLTTALTTVGSVGKRVADNLDATISSRSTYAGVDTAGTTTLLSRIPGTVQPQTGDAYARLGAPSGASVSADIAAVPTANANADALLDRADAIETGWTVRHWARIVFAAVAGKVSGAGTGTEIFRDIPDTKNRMVSTVDASGNRTAEVLDGS